MTTPSLPNPGSIPDITITTPDPPLYKVARYLNVILKNSQKIDKAKSKLFTEDFELGKLFQVMDSNCKGFIDVNDFKKLINDNGAEIKAFNMERIMRYFASGKTISKALFLKAIVIPPWKIGSFPLCSQNKTTQKQTPMKLLFKMVVQIYLALQEDDCERLKLKNAHLQPVFRHISQDGEYVRIDELSAFLQEKQFPQPDSFGLLRFMHNRLEVNLQEFTELFRNSLPERFQIYEKLDSCSFLCERVATSRKNLPHSSNKVKKKQTTDTDFSDYANLTMVIEGNHHGESANNLCMKGKQSVILERSSQFQITSILGSQNSFHQNQKSPSQTSFCKE